MRLALAPAIAATLLTSLPPAVAAPSGADDVRALAARKAAVIALMHEKAKRALVTAAQDRVYAEYFGADAPEEKARLKARIDQVALGVQARFQVAEMCLIDRPGGEISLFFGRAGTHDPDPDKTGKPPRA